MNATNQVTSSRYVFGTVGKSKAQRRVYGYLSMLALGGLLLLPIVTASCAEAGPPRQMKAMIHGVNCDPDNSTLVAETTNENQIDSFDDLRRYELYRTKGGNYFIQSEVGYDISLNRLSASDAQNIYNEMKQDPACEGTPEAITAATN